MAADSSSQGNDGTVQGAVWTNGIMGSALEFDDTTDYVEVGTNGWTAAQGTVALWARLKGFSGQAYLFGHTTQPQFANRIQLYTDPRGTDPTGQLAVGLGDQHIRQANIKRLDTNRWTHLALTWDGTTYVVYVDGVEEARGEYTGLSTLNAFANIGNTGGTSGSRNQALNGIVDDVRVYTHPMTAQEVQALVPNRAPTVEAGQAQTITLPNTATLNGTVSDDGVPDPPGAITTVWSQVSGPGTVIFANPNAVDTIASFSVTGTYVLQLTATDSALTTFDTVTVTVNPAAVAVPDVVGLPQGAAQSTLTSAGLAVGQVTTVFSPTVPARQVIRQAPTAGTLVLPGTAVDLVISEGPRPVVVPDVVGLTQQAAQTALTNAGLTVGAVTSATSTTVPAGDVISQNPSAGTNVAPGSTVDLVVSSGPENEGPLVEAGLDQRITFPNTATLDGTVTDDGLPIPPGKVTTTWNRVSWTPDSQLIGPGQGTVIFADPTAVDTTASFSDTGTYVLRLTATDGAVSTSDDVTITVKATLAQSEPHDLNADGTADILWRNELSGVVAGWLMQNAAIASVGVVGGTSSAWAIDGVGDVDGDGQADVVWRQTVTGAVAVWLMNGLTIKQIGELATLPLTWTIDGVGDVDGDGNADIVWRDTTTGEVAIWLMNGLTVKEVGIPGIIPLSWSIEVVGDTDGDGNADIVWRNLTNGNVAIWLMNGLAIKQVGIPGSVPLSWAIEGIGDTDDDGKADIVWRNRTNGNVAIWLMNGLTINQVGIPGNVALSWTLEEVGDVNGNGSSDLVWYQTNTGVVATWLMNGLVISQVTVPGNVGTDWEIQ